MTAPQREMGRDGRKAFSYAILGLHLRSEIALPELGPLTSDEASDADIRVSLGQVEAAGEAALRGGFVRRTGPDEVVIETRRSGRFRIAAGREVIVHPAPDVPEGDIRAVLLGSVLGLLCHQRGLLPLHANALDFEGAAIVFAGPSGAGKSTLAAHFLDRGYRMMADDVCAIGFGADGRPVAYPGVPRVKLWPDALAATGRVPDAYPLAASGSAKRAIDARAAASGPLPLERIYILDRGDDPAPVRIRGTRALRAVLDNVYRARWVDLMRRRQAYLDLCMTLAQRTAIFTGARRWGLDRLAFEARRLEAHARRSLGLPDAE